MTSFIEFLSCNLYKAFVRKRKRNAHYKKRSSFFNGISTFVGLFNAEEILQEEQ